MSKYVASKSNSDERDVRVFNVLTLCRRVADAESFRVVDRNGGCGADAADVDDGGSVVNGRFAFPIEFDRFPVQFEHVYGIPGGCSGAKTGC